MTSATVPPAVAERRDAARRMLAAGDPTRAAELLDGRADADPTGESLVLLGDALFLLARVGTLCEGHRPEGFGFGEALFQVFILNASWRLLGDRFYTDDYRPEIYTQEGLDRVDAATLEGVLLRHLPGLAETGIGNVRNAFEPWDEGRLDPARHPTRAFAEDLDDPWAGERSRA